MTDAPLLLVAHGTDDERGRATIESIATRVRVQRPALEVSLAFVTPRRPTLTEALARVAKAATSSVVVPLFLARGFHVAVEIPRAAQDSPDVRVTEALGPSPLIATMLAERLEPLLDREAETAVILAAAGSSDPRAQRDVETQGEQLAQVVRRRVEPAYLSAAEPSVEAALESARSRFPRVAVASYLLARGAFSARLARIVPGAHTEPFGDDPRVAELVLRRYDRMVELAAVR